MGMRGFWAHVNTNCFVSTPHAESALRVPVGGSEASEEEGEDRESSESRRGRKDQNKVLKGGAQRSQ